MSYGKKCFVSNRISLEIRSIFYLVKFPTLFQRTCFLIKLYNKYQIDSFNSHCSAGYHHCSRDGWMSNYDSGTAAMEVVIMFS